MSLQLELLNVTKQIKEIKEKYKEEKQEANRIHKDITKREQEELKDLISKDKELRELVIDDIDFIDGISKSSRKDFEINLEELPEKYFKIVPNEDLIREEMVQSEWTRPIPGVKTIDKYTLRVQLSANEGFRR